MTRWRIDLSYDGTGFHGWAAQGAGLRTVQGLLEEWIARLLGLSEVKLTVAGRTDAGVHARGQVAHLDLPDYCDVRVATELLHRLNRVLPDDVLVKSITIAPEGFDARFAAFERRYCYRIWDADSCPDPLLRTQVLQVPERLDVPLMDDAAKTLLGLRDFVAFSKYREGASTIRSLLRFDVIRADDHCRTIEATLAADAFTHSMVRSLMGAITQVGAGKRSVAWLEDVACSPTRCGEVPVLPPVGLTLEEVCYPPPELMNHRVQQSRAMRSVA